MEYKWNRNLSINDNMNARFIFEKKEVQRKRNIYDIANCITRTRDTSVDNYEEMLQERALSGEQRAIWILENRLNNTE